MEELEFCPFCGSEKCETYTAVETSFARNYDLTMREVVTFSQWGAGCDDCSANVYGFATEEEAIKAWNRRV